MVAREGGKAGRGFFLIKSQPATDPAVPGIPRGPGGEGSGPPSGFPRRREEVRQDLAASPEYCLSYTQSFGILANTEALPDHDASLVLLSREMPLFTVI